MSTEPVSTTEAARRLGVSRRAVQLDVANGCDGIIRPGTPGPGNGALLDLSEYTAWRARRAGADPDPTRERERAWSLLCAAALRTVQDHGGITRQSRQHSAGLLLALLQRMHPLLIGGPLDPVPDQLRILFRILRDSG
jgi:hypothetical protein